LLKKNNEIKRKKQFEIPKEAGKGEMK